MKRVLITGATGFIGSYLVKHLEGYEIQTLSLRDSNWQNKRFNCDVIIHCAGIAHVSKHIDESIYHKVNYELTLELAEKAKKEQVKQFIFLSSQLIYGVGHIGEITESIIPSPQNAYGRSKLNAEVGLAKLSDQSFLVASLRLPLVYGMSPKGNLKTLMTLSKYLIIFPKVENKRSVISLSAIHSQTTEIIDDGKIGNFNVSDSDPIATYQIVQATRLQLGQTIFLISLFNPVVYFLRKKLKLVGKVFGDAYFTGHSESQGETIFNWISNSKRGK